MGQYYYVPDPGEPRGGFSSPIQDRMSFRHPQPMMQQSNGQSMQTLPPPSSNGIIWVQGEAGAKAYPIDPGTTILLMDSEEDVFYIKSRDVSGKPLPLQAFDYRERTVIPKTQQDYVPRSEFDALAARVAALTNMQQEKEDTENG